MGLAEEKKEAFLRGVTQLIWKGSGAIQGGQSREWQVPEVSEVDASTEAKSWHAYRAGQGPQARQG